ncbi:ABC transporter permease [Helicobacter jaachi]|uniref:ABC transporter permease n=1 Tax=Helicobacter jaachi TaxID=1677920 RepID=A0A4V6I258_9HELI|nr:ABC transporter permease [Helicobacter jaachi]TLD94652.1 ABC transporter permease [Helicobacter jaachi]
MTFTINSMHNRIYIQLQGRCDYTLKKSTQRALARAIEHSKVLSIDFSGVSKVDFVFCAFVYELLEGRAYELIGTSTQIDEIFDTLKSTLPRQKQAQEQNISLFYRIWFIFTHLFMFLGKRVEQFFHTCLDFLQFCGMCLWYFFRAVLHPHYFKLSSIFYHINEAGFKALPVALLTSFIVSYAIALQGVLQLDRMGVPLMSVEIVAKLCLREMGPFILAIVIAGRSASAFSAQIGVMNLTEENDALKTMNLSLFDYLILPRVLALVIVMPLLVFLADAISLFGAMLAIKIQAGINFVQYLERFYEYVSIEHFWVGVIKAPFFGATIALIGCFRGLCVKGDAESVGLETTKSVVNVIFWVILINALFSLITTRLGI